MRVEYIVQNNDNNLYNYLKLEMQNSYNNIYVFTKCIKESGLDVILDNLLDEKTKMFVITGIDKKNTNKGILEKLLEFSKDVYVFDNNNEVQFENNVLILENKKIVNIYMFGGEFTDLSITSNINIISKSTFDLTNDLDKKEYKMLLSKLIDIKEIEGFSKLSKNIINDLIDDKVIFSTKVYNHSVKSISELLGKKKEKEVVTPNLEDVDINVDFNNMNNIDIDFDLEEAEESEENIKKENSKSDKNDLDIEIIEDDLLEEENLLKENDNNYNFSFNNDMIDEEDDDLKDDSNFDENSTLDINSLLFSESDLELSNKSKKVEEQDKVISKKIDLKTVSSYIFELPDPKKDKNQIKIPNYIKMLIPDFFDMDNTKQVKINDTSRKERKVLIEIVDVKNDAKYLDKDAFIMHEKGKSNIAFLSDIFNEIKYEENDILRITKTNSNVYHFEFISKNLQESKVWEKLMNQKFRNNERKYGFM